MRKVKLQTKEPDEGPEGPAARLAAEVASITDSLLKEISCEEIEKSIEASKPFFVFFGT